MLSGDTKESIKLYLRDLIAKNKIDDDITYLDEYLDYINTKYNDSYGKVINDYLASPMIQQRTQLKSFLCIELFLGQLADILHLKDNKPDISLPSDNKQINTSNLNWGMERLYKIAFELFAREYNLTNESNPINLYKKNISGYEYHFLNLYYYRNNIGEHYNANSSINSLSPDRIEGLTQSMLYALLYLMEKHHEDLLTAINRNSQNQFNRSFDSKSYANTIVNEYSRNQSFEYLDTKWNVNADTTGLTIKDIINENYNKKIIAFIGEAGTGKTTALRRLEYEYAKKCSKNSFKGLPIYIELKYLQPSDSALLKAVASRLNISLDNAKNVLNYEAIVILLDGFNEISDKQFAASIKNEAEIILESNDKILLFITDRTNKYTQFNVIQTTFYLYLHEISMDEKILFFESNSHKPSSIDLIKKQIDEELSDKRNPIIQMLRTPYMLSVFLSYIEKYNAIPDDTITNYIERLFEREEKEQKDSDDPKHFEKMKTVLAAFACKYESNEFKRLDAQRLVGRIKELFGYNDLDSIECIELSIKMGLIETSSNNTLRFCSKEFYEYFYMYAITVGLDEYLTTETHGF